MAPNPSDIIKALTHPSSSIPTPRLANRRVRAAFNGAFVVDCTKAVYVWEHKYYPQFWVHGIVSADPIKKIDETKDKDGKVLYSINEGSSGSGGAKKTFRFLTLSADFGSNLGHEGAELLNGLSRVHFADMGENVRSLSM
jgi:hypothetical protein